ncbi:hypothetical protein ACFL0X_02470 [Nanoarchaeota archaeon]
MPLVLLKQLYDHIVSRAKQNLDELRRERALEIHLEGARKFASVGKVTEMWEELFEATARTSFLEDDKYKRVIDEIAQRGYFNAADIVLLDAGRCIEKGYPSKLCNLTLVLASNYAGLARRDINRTVKSLRGRLERRKS